MNMTRILAFGDSITYGAWDTQSGWAERIKSRAHIATVASQGSHKVQVINLGIGGDTSRGLLKRIKSEIQSRVSANWPFVFLISIGTNDQREVQGKPEVGVDEYASNLMEIITIAKQYTDSIIVLGLPPLGAPALDFKGQVYSDEHVRQYDNILKSIAERQGVEYFDTRSLFESHDSLFAYDMIHPNDAGHEVIAESVVKLLANHGIEI